jgi:putative transposase
MPHIKKQKIPECIYFVTTVTSNRQKFFIKDEFCDILIKEFNFYRNKFKFLFFGYVIMPDHLHLLIMTGKKGTISDIMRDIKHHSSTQVNHLLERNGRVWQEDFYPEIIDEEKFFHQKLDYIHNNPIKHGYVEYPDEWRYSSYRNYFLDDESVIEIDRFD